jgi:Flp pilus assembly protein TadD
MTSDKHSADEMVAEGLNRQQAGDTVGAETRYRQALAVDPQHPDAHHLLGVLFFARGELQKAYRSVTTAITIRPDISIYYNNLSLIFQSLKDFDGAVAAASRAVDLAPADAGALTTLGVSQQLGGEPRASIMSYRSALRINPAAAQTRLNLATAHLELNEFSSAEEHFRHVCSDPTLHRQAALGLAKTLIRANKPEEAISVLKPLTRGDGVQPPLALTLGDAFLKNGQSEDALALIDTALDTHPDDAALRNFRGHVLRDLDRPEEAILEFETVLAEHPDHIDALVNLGLTHLALERYETGWGAYRNRERRPDVQRRRPSLSIPDLDAESVDGADLTVWTEQGLGDEILQASLIPDLAARTTSLTVLCSDRLRSLFVQSFPGVHFADKVEPTFEITSGMRSCPLLDTAKDLRPRRSAFPHHSGYIIADKSDVADIRRRYLELCRMREEGNSLPPYVVGLSWRSGNSDYGLANTIPLSAWQPIMHIARASRRSVIFIALQYDASGADAASLPEALRRYFHIDPSVDHLGSVDRVAAQVAACDLVITTSTTTAQLAGALGLPTWHLPATGLARGWYWTFNEDRTPWYPSMQQIQRHQGMGYRDQVTEVAKRLSILLN